MGSLPPVLIVDDDGDDIFILKRLLLKAGVENKVIAFEDSTAAVVYLESESRQPESRYIPWIVFTDLHMPRMDGLEFVRWIRTKPVFSNVVVLMVTSSEDPSDAQKAHDCGVNRLLAKYPSVGTLQKLAVEFRGVMKVFPDHTGDPAK